MLSLVCLLAPGWLGTATTATAQDAKDDRIARPELRATRTATPPVLDGDVRGDDAWLGAMEARRFIQNTPDEGQPASQETAVYVVYDDTTLYIGVVCFDLEPDRIIVSDSRRDASLSESDSFQVILDTFGDHQTGFVFGTNPAGIQYDGQVNRDGEGGIGTSGGFNLNWDGEWEVQTQVFADGWGAELAIPFRTLRFPKGNPQSWGLNFQRNIRRHNESAFWAPLPRQFGINRVSLAGTLHGLEVPRQRVLQVIPYVLGEAAEGLDTAAGGESSTDEDFEAGFDLKYSVTASLTLDATYNTDFAQVEADVQQINLDRFNLFFPEKRPFFLENAGAFSVGVPEEVELFFSRRIGIGDGGSDVPIEGGLRLSGKAGRTNVGLLVMGTDDVPGVTPDNTFGVIRLSRDLGTKSSVGMIVTERRGRAALGEDRESRRTFGIDGRWGIGQKAELVGFVAQTETPDAEGDEHAFRVGGRWDSETFVGQVNYTEVGDDFNPAVGFLSRSGYRKPDGFVLWRIRPEKLWGLHELRPHVSYRGFWDFDGFQETGFLHVDNHWEWKNGHEVHTGVNFTREGVKEAFEIFPGVIVPPGTYNHEELLLVAFTNRGAPVGIEGQITAGGFFGGDRLAVTPTLRFRVGERFNAEAVWSHNDIDLPGGSFKTNLARLRLSYSFSPQIFIDGLVQYNDRLDQWSSNVRFGWRDASSTGFYVVYNDIQEIGREAGESQRRLIIKYSRLINLLGR